MKFSIPTSGVLAHVCCGVAGVPCAGLSDGGHYHDAAKIIARPEARTGNSIGRHDSRTQGLIFHARGVQPSPVLENVLSRKAHPGIRIPILHAGFCRAAGLVFGGH